MDVSRYNFKCQKALHLGWRLARKLSHANLEVEHVALAFLQNSLIALDDIEPKIEKKKIEKMLHAYLVARPRVVGIKKVEFGPRIDKALDMAESEKKLVDEFTLWENLKKQSTILNHATNDDQDNLDNKIIDEQISKIEKEVFQVFEEEQSKNPGSESSDSKPKKNTNLKKLEKYAVNLTRRAHDGELDPVIGRDEEVRRVLEVLGRKRKNNPLLTGPAGVGKTAIIEALAQRISDGKVPPILSGKQIYSLDMNAMLAGLDSISNLSRLAASSIKSIALSGRFLSGK